MTTTIPTLDDFAKHNRCGEFSSFEPDKKLIVFHSYLDLISFVNEWGEVIDEDWTIEYIKDARDFELFYTWNRVGGVEAGTKVTITNYCSDYHNKSRTYIGKDGKGLSKSTVVRLLNHFDNTELSRRSSALIGRSSASFIFKV